MNIWKTNFLKNIKHHIKFSLSNSLFLSIICVFCSLLFSFNSFSENKLEELNANNYFLVTEQIEDFHFDEIEKFSEKISFAEDEVFFFLEEENTFEQKINFISYSGTLPHSITSFYDNVNSNILSSGRMPITNNEIVLTNSFARTLISKYKVPDVLGKEIIIRGYPFKISGVTNSSRQTEFESFVFINSYSPFWNEVDSFLNLIFLEDFSQYKEVYVKLIIEGYSVSYEGEVEKEIFEYNSSIEEILHTISFYIITPLCLGFLFLTFFYFLEYINNKNKFLVISSVLGMSKKETLRLSLLEFVPTFTLIACLSSILFLILNFFSLSFLQFYVGSKITTTIASVVTLLLINVIFMILFSTLLSIDILKKKNHLLHKEVRSI